MIRTCPVDVLKLDADDEGVPGDNAPDALCYLAATKPRTLEVRTLSGLQAESQKQKGKTRKGG